VGFKKNVEYCEDVCYLFSILAEWKLTLLEYYEGGFQSDGRRLTNLRYADDMLLACSEIQLQELVNRHERVSRKYGLLINVEKTNIMTTDGTSCNSEINNYFLERVTSFPYLGSLITH